MAVVSNVRNDGNPAVKTGPKKVNSFNVAPYNIVATPSPGTLITKVDVANYEFFNAVQTSASTDLIQLQSTIGIGDLVVFYCVSACKVGTVSGSGVTVNGGTDAQVITLAVGSMYEFRKTSATTWVCQATDASGAKTSPTPA